MARHPAPTFVFADLVGFTALTSEMPPQEVVAENLLLLQVAFLRDALSRRGV